jgi:hypothetical protein
MIGSDEVGANDRAEHSKGMTYRKPARGQLQRNSLILSRATDLAGDTADSSLDKCSRIAAISLHCVAFVARATKTGRVQRNAMKRALAADYTVGDALCRFQLGGANQNVIATKAANKT